MSESETKFEIEVSDDVTIGRNSMVEHAEHGPMHVDSIRVGPNRKTAELKSELGPVGLELTGDQLREQWGETIAQDPFELRDAGTAKFTNTGMTTDESDVEVDITVEGPESDAEAVQMHAVDQIVRAIQAVSEEQPPSECEGAPFELDWETILDKEGK